MVMGLTQGASSLGRVFGPAVSGEIYQSLGHSSPFGLGAAIMLLALGAAFIVAAKGRAKPEVIA